MSRRGAALAGVVSVLTGCTYYNTIHNAERLYEEAEQHRRAGRDSIAEVRYQDVIRKTADAYRARPSGERADETLFLLGMANLRTGGPRAARLALEEAARITDTPGMRARILVYLAQALSRLGDEAGASARVEEALDAGLTGPVLAEAYLLRGRLLLRTGYTDLAWSDLELAGEVDPGVRLEAGIERLRASIHYGDPDRTRRALDQLLGDADADVQLDTIGMLIRSAAARWDPAVAASLLASADSSRWDQPARGRVRLARARLLYAAGDTIAASDQAWRVSEGRGASAAEARLLLANWRLNQARDLAAAYSVRAILLPASDDPEVAALVDALDVLDRYASLGFDQPLGWFAAAEVARDRLEAPILARGLFLAYADTDPADPWAPKALLAALSVSGTEDDRSWLRGRLEAHRDSPYVLAARGVAAAGFEALEEELLVRLTEVRSR